MIKRQPGTRWLVVGFAVGAGVVAAMQVGKVPPALPVIRVELNLGLVAGGWVASLFSVVAAVLGMAAGVASDRIGARRTVVGALGMVVIGSVVGGLAPSLPWLLLARLLESIGFVGIVVAAPALIVQASAPEDQRFSVGIWSAYLPAGVAFMLLLSPYVLTVMDWRALWFSNAALVLVFLLAFAAVTRQAGAIGSTPVARRGWHSVASTLLRPGLWLLALCFMLYSLQWFAIMTWLPTFLIETEGETAAAAGIVTALVVLINVGGNLGGTWLLQRNVSRSALILLSALATAIAGGGIFADFVPVESKLALAFLYSLLSGVTPAAAIIGAVVHAPSPGHIAASNGIVIQGAQCGSLLGPPVLAWIVAGGGDWQHAPWLFLVGSGLSIVLALLLRWVER